MMTKQPSGKPKNVAEYVSWQISLCGKSQAQIAEECGFEKPNVITMIKQGKTKVPMKKIGRMAKALEIDPVFFLKLCLQEYSPDTLEAISLITGGPVITKNEAEFIELIRTSKVSNPRFANQDQRDAFVNFVNDMKSDNEFESSK